MNDYKATEKGHLLRHIESIHEGIRYPCDQCEYKATQRENLRTHINSIHESINKAKPCAE